MRKFLGLLAIFALAALSDAGLASASSNLPDGTVLAGTNNGGISLTGVVTCNHSTVNVILSNNAAGHGVHGSITAASFTSCFQPGGASASVNVTNLPWTLTTTGTGPIQWTGQVDGVDLHVTLNSTTDCHYRGNPSGGNYDNTTEMLTLAGNVSLQSGSSFICAVATPTVDGRYTVAPTLQLS